MPRKPLAEMAMPEYTLGEEIFNAVSHGVGALLSVVALVAMLLMAAGTGEMTRVVASVVYGATLLTLYSMSTLYHSLRGKAKRVMRIFDHSSIYLLIAGTYTPYTLILMPGTEGSLLLIAIWCAAALGIALAVFDLERFKKFSMACYIVMGWAVVFAMQPLSAALAPAGLQLMLAGGVAYMLGLIFYGLKRFRYMHSVWHLFVLGGSLMHFFSILFYVLPA